MKIIELFSSIFSVFCAAVLIFGVLIWVGIFYLIKILTQKNVNNYYYQYPPNQYQPNQYPLAKPIRQKKIYKVRKDQ